MKDTIRRFYKSAWGYLLFWSAVGLAVDCVTLGGFPSWEDISKLNTFGLIFFYAGIIAAMATHTRFKYSCHNWYLALAFWLFSNRVFSNSRTDAPVYAGEDGTWFLAVLFGLWLIYSKLESKGEFHSKE